MSKKKKSDSDSSAVVTADAARDDRSSTANGGGGGGRTNGDNNAAAAVWRRGIPARVAAVLSLTAIAAGFAAGRSYHTVLRATASALYNKSNFNGGRSLDGSSRKKQDDDDAAATTTSHGGILRRILPEEERDTNRIEVSVVPGDDAMMIRSREMDDTGRPAAGSCGKDDVNGPGGGGSCGKDDLHSERRDGKDPSSLSDEEEDDDESDGEEEDSDDDSDDDDEDREEKDMEDRKSSSSRDGEERKFKVSGFHLLVNMENPDRSFLSSEERLYAATQNLIETIGGNAALLLLSHHCQVVHHEQESSFDLVAGGVKCVALFNRGHLSYRTVPAAAVIALDLFLHRGRRQDDQQQSLLPVVDVVKKIFGPPAHVSQVYYDCRWAIKHRGVRNGPNYYYAGDFDMRADLEHVTMKNHVATVKSKYQTITFWESIDTRAVRPASFRKAAQGNDDDEGSSSYESRHPELFQLEREVYLDGVLQSRGHGEAAYHEALVHPALFSHDHPARVAIVGGGEGATLREVLKHRTVERVTMVEIDEIMVTASRRYIPAWSDCSDLMTMITEPAEGNSNSTGSSGSQSCFDDPRADVRFMDAVAWLLGTYSNADQVNEEDRYDVIIMDALDPSSEVPFSDVLYRNKALVQAIYNALTATGVLVAQLGIEDQASDVPSKYDPTEVQVETLFKHMVEVGFESLKDMSESHGGFDDVWSFVVAFKDAASGKKNWHAAEAAVARNMQRRAVQTRSGRSPFRYFDGATMQAYQYPSRILEDAHCQNETVPAGCERGHGYDPNRPHNTLPSFLHHPTTTTTSDDETTASSNGTCHVVFERSTTTTTTSSTSSPKRGSYSAIDESVHGLLIYPSTYDLIHDMTTTTRRSPNAADTATAGLFFRTAAVLERFTTAYGLFSQYYGGWSVYVNPAVVALVNHGCSGSGNGTISDTTARKNPRSSPPVVPRELSVTEGGGGGSPNIQDDDDHDHHEFAPQGDDILSYAYNSFLDRNHWIYLSSIDVTAVAAPT